MLKKLFLPILFASLITPIFLGRMVVHADPRDLSVTVNWNESSCIGSVNGGAQIYDFDVVQGDTANLHITNSYSAPLTIENNFAAIGTVNPGQSFDTSTAVGSSLISISATPSSSICSSKAPASIFIDGQTGSLSCNFYNGDSTMWGVYGSISWNDPDATMGIFDGSSLVSSFTNHGNNLSGYLYTGSSAAITHTFYMRIGTTSSGPLLATTTCPAYTPSNTTNSSGSTGTSSNNSSGSKSTTSKTSTTPTPTPTTLPPSPSPSQTPSSGDKTDTNLQTAQTASGDATPATVVRHSSLASTAVIVPTSLVVVAGLAFATLKLGWLSSLKKYLPKKP